MPELPEVQITVDDLNASGLTGLRISRARVYWPSTIAMPSVQEFRRSLNKQTIVSIDRRGKFILFELSNTKTMAVHLRMTGRFVLSDNRIPIMPHVHVVIEFDDGRQLRFHDTRKFGRFYLVSDKSSVIGLLGIEPLSKEFSARKLSDLLKARNRRIKPLLLDQTTIAGLGNIYVDEALWKAGIHPLRPASTLVSKEIVTLHCAIGHVLRQGLKNSGTTLGRGKNNFYSPVSAAGRNDAHLKVFRRSQQPCLRCGHLIERILVGQRSTHICPYCQRTE